MEDDCDIIIIGAGIAGTACALRCARAGLSVLLLERAEIPGSKNLSGGRLYTHALAELLPQFHLTAPLERRITHESLSLLTPDGVTTFSSLQPGGESWSVLRARFDPWLVAEAEKEGVECIPGATVDALYEENGRVCGVICGDDILRARYVVLAEGASSFLADRVEEEGEVRVFIEHNDNFRLPANPETPVIMIGPGTGIAPFRAFMQQRAADEAPGKNWLFFGNPHFTEDFLYQVEWQRYVKDGVLTRIDLAWSRDQKEKVYVQDKLREQGAELWRWINDGAHIYVCGDANRMAKDVEQALLEVIAEFGGMDTEAADEFLSELRVERRYQRDVY